MLTNYKHLYAIVCMLLATLTINAKVGEYVYVFKDGKVIFKEQASLVAAPIWNADSTEVTLSNTSGITCFNGVADSVSYTYARPTADVLDIQFNADGTVIDISPMQNPVSVVSPSNNSKVPVYYSETYKNYVGQFWNNYGNALGDQPVFAKVDYANNTEFLNALKSGHTLECLFRLNYPEGGITNVEVKPFASHQQGGTGIMVCTKTRGLNSGNELTFLPNVSANGATSSWKWGVSGVTPQDSVYYHVVGVWDKDNGKAHIYVNGELKNTVAAEGDLHLNSSTAYHWFGIGCDSYSGTGEAGAHFDIVNARIYSKPLQQEDVNKLWSEMAGLTQVDTVVTPSYDIEPEPIDTTTTTGKVMLDIEFNADGTAYDASPNNLKVETINNGGIIVAYNKALKRNVATFSNPWSGSPKGYYKVDYESNAAFKAALADGHTLECLVRPSFTEHINTEVKPFASHQAGGTGFLLCYPGEGSAKNNEFTFLPNVSTNGSSVWRWCTSGEAVQSNTYYHLVGIWNKEKGTAEIYVNGELKNTIAAVGDLKFPSSGSNWFAIGCDAAPGTGTNSFTGEIVTARVYDDPLTSQQVDSLWAIVKEGLDEIAPALVSNYSFVSGLTIAPGSTFPIKGEGFAENDSIKLISVTDENAAYLLPTTLTETGVLMQVNDEIQSGNYYICVVRGENTQDLGVCNFIVSQTFPKGAQVIAHRGFWTKGKGTSQNSCEALQNAVDGDFYGSETDAWITSDGVVVINHNSTINSVSIQNNPYSSVQNMTLSNGEKLPTLEDYLNIMDKSTTKTKLVIEIKTHSNTNRGYACCDSVVAAVKRHGLQDKVEYIAYSLNNCRRLVMNDSTAMVQYLNGDKEPSDLCAIGVMGLDYTKAQLATNDRIDKAHDLKMVTNAYTIDTQNEMAEVNNMGIDFITTNYPVQAQAIYEYYRDNQPEGPKETEAYLALKEYVAVCDSDTIDYTSEKYDQTTVEAYTKALDEARTAVEEMASDDATYDSLRINLIEAREAIAIAYKKGDVNLDGSINGADVVSIYNYIQAGEASNITSANADVNEDQSVNGADVVTVYNLIVGSTQSAVFIKNAK